MRLAGFCNLCTRARRSHADPVMAISRAHPKNCRTAVRARTASWHNGADVAEHCISGRSITCPTSLGTSVRIRLADSPLRRIPQYSTTRLGRRRGSFEAPARTEQCLSLGHPHVGPKASAVPLPQRCRFGYHQGPASRQNAEMNRLTPRVGGRHATMANRARRAPGRLAGRKQAIHTKGDPVKKEAAPATAILGTCGEVVSSEQCLGGVCRAGMG
jgi:hypothetical protein